MDDEIKYRQEVKYDVDQQLRIKSLMKKHLQSEFDLCGQLIDSHQKELSVHGVVLLSDVMSQARVLNSQMQDNPAVGLHGTPGTDLAPRYALLASVLFTIGMLMSPEFPDPKLAGPRPAD